MPTNRVEVNGTAIFDVPDSVMHLVIAVLHAAVEGRVESPTAPEGLKGEVAE